MRVRPRVVSLSIKRCVLLTLSCVGIASLLFSPLGALAAEKAFPTKPVKWIVPYPAGGSVDLVGRVVAAKLYGIWGQTAVLENRAGAGGRLGTEAVAGAHPDGYTQLLTLNTNYTIDQSMFKSMAYDPVKAFAPITILASTGQVLVTNPSFPAKTVKDLIALAKTKRIKFGSSGVGGSLHLAMEYFRSVTGLDMLHVPYKGGPPAATDLMAGEIDVMFFNTPAATPYIKSGRLRAIAVSTANREELLPDVPTIAESGLPGFDVDVWYGLAAPTGTPQAIVNKTYNDIAGILKMSDVREQIAKLGADPVGSTPEETAARIRNESANWSKVIRGLNMTFE